MIITAQGDGPNGKPHDICSFDIKLERLLDSSLSNAARKHLLLFGQKQQLDQLSGGYYSTKVYLEKAEILDMFAFVFQDANLADTLLELSERIESIRRLKVVDDASAAASEQDQF